MHCEQQVQPTTSLLSLSDLRDNFKTSREYFDNKIVPIDLLKDFTDLLELVATDPVLHVYEKAPEFKKYFFEEFLPGIVKRVSNIKNIEDQVSTIYYNAMQHLPIIERFVMTLCELFYKELERDNSDVADAMRYIFDSTSNLNQNLFQSEDSVTQAYDNASGDKLPDEEKTWRKSLQVGDKVDAIKKDNEYNLKTWAKGQVTDISNMRIQVTFENDSKSATRVFMWYSPELAQYGTKSQDESWKDDLKAGDFIDALDSTKIWYSSTIQDKEIRTEDDREVPYLKIGFRVFHPEGNKTDDDNNRFFGWSKQFDEWMPIGNARIQKYQTYVKTMGDESETKQIAGSVTYEETLDDQMDLLLYNNKSQQLFAHGRRRCKSSLLVQFLNKFGEIGGFDRIEERIQKDKNEAMGLEQVFYLVDCLAKSTCMFNKGFLDSYLPSLTSAVHSKLLLASEQSLRSIKKDRIDGIVNNLIGTLSARVKTYKQREWDKTLLNLEIGGVFLQQNFLERRIDGAKIIQEVSKNTNLSTYTSSVETTQNSKMRQLEMEFVKKVVNRLKDLKVLYQIFSKERGHLQLVQRSEELLKLLIGQDAFSREDMQFVWSSTKIDEATKLEVYKIINELSNRLREQEVSFIIEEISNIPLNKIIFEQLELVNEMTKRTRSAESDYGMKAVEFIWNLTMTQNESIEKALVNQAALYFTEAIKNWNNQQKLIYIQRISQNLQQNIEGFLSIKMLQRLLKDFQGSPQKMIEDKDSTLDPQLDPETEKFSNKSKFIEYIFIEYNFMQAIFENFKDYMLRARQSLRLKLSTDQNTDLKSYHDKVLADKFIHSEQLSERLEFLRYLSTQSSNVKINLEQLQTLWNELVIHNIFQQDSNMFYRWLKDACDSQSIGESSVNTQDLIEFYQTSISEEGNKVMKHITIDGFNCIKSFFILVNESNKKLIKLQRFDKAYNNNQNTVKKFTSYSKETGEQFQSYSFNQSKQGGQGTNDNMASDEDIDFQIQVNPDQLDSISSIWDIAVSAQDSKVIDKSTEFLIKLYTSVTFRLESKLSQFEDEFISICIKNIKELRDKIEARVGPHKEEFERVDKPITQFSQITTSVLSKILPPEEKAILRYIAIIKELIKHSEIDGTLGVKSHAALFKGQFLPTIQVQNQLFTTGNRYRSKHEIGVQSNTTLWELRKIIGQHVTRVYQREDDNALFIQDMPFHPAAIRIYRYTGCVDLKECDNGKTLAELRFKPNEQLTVYRRNMYNVSRVPLINDDHTQISDKAIDIFTKWFNRYSVSDPTEEDPHRRVMTPATCAAFTRSCTEDMCTEEDQRVTGLFIQYDSNNDGKIELEEFLTFYTKCCFEKEEVVRQNLMSHNIRFDLRKEPTYGDDEWIMQVRKSKEDMPRYKISNNPEYFDVIFSLFNHQGEVSNHSWSLLKTLTTNPNLYQKVLTLNQDSSFSWDQIFDSTNIYKMLYTLQIVESLLEEDDNQQLQQTDDEHDIKKDWIERFLASGGFQEILNLFHSSIDLLAKKQVDTLTKFDKGFLEYMLKLIRIFILSAYSATDNSVYDLLSLVKKTSSIQQQEQTQTGEDQQKQEEGENIYKTPAKQIKNHLISTFNDLKKKVNFDDNVHITQEFLFGETQQDKPDPEQQDKENGQADKKKDKQQVNAPKENSPQQTDESTRFSKMALIMKDTGLGEQILEKIDFKDLQLQVIEVVCLILGKKEINTEDILIMENALSLWVTSLVKNDTLIEEFYKITRGEGQAGFYGIKNAEEFIVAGVYSYKSYRVREEFVNTLLVIAQKVQKTQKQMPLFFLLKTLVNNFPREDQYYATRECKQFFDLFIGLVDEYINIAKQDKLKDLDQQYLVDPFDLLRESIEKLKKHETKEKKSSILEDKTLIGYFNLIEKLSLYLYSSVDKFRLLEVLEDTNLMHELFYENLFYNPMCSRSKVENKSKTKESRAACYSLIQKLIECLEPRELADFMEDNLFPLIKDMPRPKKWKYVPAENTKSTSFVGIINLGCICYMISMLQQFFMVPQFRYQLLKAENSSPEDLKDYKGHRIDDNLLKQLQRMFGYLELSEKQAYDPVGFCFSFKDFDGNPTNTALQQDSQEFLNIFFDRLEELLKPTSQKHLLEGVFGGKVCSQLICQECGNVRNILESFYNLSLPVKDRRGLDDSLEKMIEGSLINDYKCEACQQKVDVFKRSLIADTPNVLIVHLQRIIFNFDTFQNDKVNTRFEFPNILNLKDYSFKEVMSQEGRLEAFKQKNQDPLMEELLNMDDQEFIYKLVGVNIHKGTAEHGHYYSLINVKRGQEEVDVASKQNAYQDWSQTEKDPWREFNDEQVKFFTFSEMQQEAFGGNYSNAMDDNEMSAYLMHSGTASSYGQNAYMLVYERLKKKQLKEIVTNIDHSESTEPQSTTVESDDQAALECVDTANSRTADQPPPSQSEALIPYRKVEPQVPESIKLEVSHDNSLFLMDRHIYHESFFNLLRGVFKHIANKVVLTQHNYKLDYVKHFNKIKEISLDLAHKTLFDLLSYYYYNTQMSDITTSFQSIIQFCDSSYSLTEAKNNNTKEFLSQFLDKAYLNDDCKHFFWIMFDCGDKTSRYYIGRVTSFVINKVYQIYDDSENKQAEKLVTLKAKADSIVTRFIKVLCTQECQKNWSRLEQFFKCLLDIGCGGKAQVEFLLTKFDIVTELIDFMLGNKSPVAVQRGEKRVNMGGQGHGNTPNFQPLIALVCFLIRFSKTPQMIEAQKEWHPIENPPPSTLIGYDLLKEQNQQEKFPLSDKAHQMIMHTCFLEQVLKEGIECEELGKVLAHFCYKNEKYSKYVAKLLLHGISRNDIEKVKNYLDVVSQVALIRDQLQRQRLEWMFGVGSLICQTNTISQTNDENEVMTKVGIKTLQNANDEVYHYRSSLIYDSIDDALLHLLWRYKGRMDTYTVHCLFSLLNLIASDDRVADYFADVPGPTYLLARYTDWIKPYLHEQLIDARKGYAGSFSAQKEEMVVKALSLYEKYENYLIQKGKLVASKAQTVEEPQNELPMIVTDIDTEENVRNLIEQSPDQEKGVTAQHAIEDQTKIIVTNPLPYIIIDTLAEKEVMSKTFDTVFLTITALTCTYTISKPTGNNNLSFPNGLFKRVFGYSQMRNAPVQQTNTHQQQEIEMQAKCINNYFQSANNLKSKTSTGVQDDYFGDEIFQAQASQQQPITRVIEDDDRQWDMVNNMNVSDLEIDNGQGYSQDNEGMPPPHRQNSGIEENVTDEPHSYKIKVIEEGANNEEQINNEEEVSARDVHAQNINIQEPQQFNYVYNDEDDQQKIPQEIVWPADIKTCEGLVYKVTVQNCRNDPVKVSLLFKEADESQPSNLQYPKGGMKSMVYSKQTRTVLLIHRINPDDSDTDALSKLMIDIQVKDKSKDRKIGGNVQIYPAPSGSKSQNQSNDKEVTKLPLDIINEDDAQYDIPVDELYSAGRQNEIDQFNQESNNQNFDIPIDEVKECPQCTVYNDANNVQCDVCEFIF